VWALLQLLICCHLACDINHHSKVLNRNVFCLSKTEPILRTDSTVFLEPNRTESQEPLPQTSNNVSLLLWPPCIADADIIESVLLNIYLYVHHVWKRCHYIFASNFAKCWLVSKILSPTDLAVKASKVIIKYPTAPQTRVGLVLKPKPRFLVKTEPKPKPRFKWESRSVLRPH